MAVRTKPPRPREREVQRTGVELLWSLGCIALRRNTGAMRVRGATGGRERLVRFSQKGASDVYGILPDGRHFEWECKRPGEWPTREQIGWLRAMNGVGGSVAFWTDNVDDLEEVARHVMAGGRIEYLGDSGQYRLVRP